MPHAEVDLGMMSKFYSELTFYSYHETKDRNAHGQRTVYISVTGVHADCGFVSVVQNLREACVISEHRVPSRYGTDYEVDGSDVHEQEDESGARLHRARMKAFEGMWLYITALEAHGEAAFEVAFTKATKAGVIGPTVETELWDREPRVLTPAEAKVASEGGHEALVAYWNNLPEIE
jgi:hypothetical protein